MKYCTRCLYPANHPLGITFDEEGVCSGCRIHEEKDILNWRERGLLLKDILKTFKSRNGRSHDCIIPVSGARDSHFIVHTVKNIYGMHPLLVTYNKHYNTRMGIRNLAYLRTLFGCDILTLTVSPEKVKKITRYTLEEMGSMYWHCIAGQTVFPVNIAVRFKIPLIIWGAHQGCDQVGMYSHMDEVEMTRKYRKDHDLMGCEAEELVKANKGISEDDVRQFFYPHDKEIERVGVRGIYLNNYIRWDSKKQHELMIDKYGYETMKQHRTFDTYNDVDCFHYSDLHDYIKFLKHGYGKAADHACREIRLKRMTREEGIGLVRKYQDVSPNEKRLALFLNWIGMTRQELFDCVNKNRNPKIWKKIGNSKWELSDSVVNHVNDPATNKVRLGKKEDCEFTVTPPKDSNSREDKYILTGRGWVDKK